MLAEDHLGFERDHTPERVEKRIDIFIGSQVLESWSEEEIASEQPSPVGPIKGDVIFRVSRSVRKLNFEDVVIYHS